MAIWSGFVAYSLIYSVLRGGAWRWSVCFVASVNFRALNFQCFHPNFGTCPDNLEGEGLQYFEFIFIVVAVRSDVNIFSFDFSQDRFRIVDTDCVLIALISFIIKFYLLFRVNFLHSKLVFH